MLINAPELSLQLRAALDQTKSAVAGQAEVGVVSVMHLSNNVQRELERRDDVVALLLGRIDRLEQRASALSKEVAAMTRRASA